VDERFRFIGQADDCIWRLPQRTQSAILRRLVKIYDHGDDDAPGTLAVDDDTRLRHFSIAGAAGGRLLVTYTPPLGPGDPLFVWKIVRKAR